MIRIPTTKINTTDDVIIFFQEIQALSIQFDLEGSFLNYKKDGVRLFEDSEAERLDKLLDDCFAVCHREQKYSIYACIDLVQLEFSL